MAMDVNARKRVSFTQSTLQNGIFFILSSTERVCNRLQSGVLTNVWIKGQHFYQLVNVRNLEQSFQKLWLLLAAILVVRLYPGLQRFRTFRSVLSVHHIRRHAAITRAPAGSFFLVNFNLTTSNKILKSIESSESIRNHSNKSQNLSGRTASHSYPVVVRNSSRTD
jgi:hypothetical protein